MSPFLLALPLASAQTEDSPKPAPVEDFSDVILVWPDKFARWRDTRWHVMTEVVLPIGMEFGKELNTSFRTHAFQVEAVIACDEDHKFSSKRIEVLCAIEDVAIRATSVDRFRNQKGRDLVQDVLDNLDGRLTGAKIQLQVNERGAVTNLDLEGIDSRNERERLQVETLRLVCARLMYPFHMKIPKSGMEEGQWPEFDSQLMSMPTSAGIQGQSMVVHFLNFYKGVLLVQDIGEGVVHVPRPSASLPSLGNILDDSADEGGPNETATVTGGDPENTIAYALRMDGVSIYNIDNGIMEERVWNVTGTPTAQFLTSLKFWYTGRIQMLGEADHPDLGKSEQIGYPGIEIQGLPVWLPVDPEMRRDLEGWRPRALVLTKPDGDEGPDKPTKGRR